MNTEICPSNRADGDTCAPGETGLCPAKARITQPNAGVTADLLGRPCICGVTRGLRSRIRVTYPRSISSASILPYTSGCRGRKGAPKQVEKVACGSLPSPFSVPATFAV